MTFAERVGGVLVAPRRTLAHVARTGEGGPRDLAILLALRVLAGEAPRLAAGVLGVPGLGAGALLRALMQSVAAIVPDLVAVLAGAVAMAIFAGKRAPRGRELEVAVYAWVPYLACTLVAALVGTALQRPLGAVADALSIAGALGGAAVWAVGLVELRRAGDEEAAP